MVEDLSRFQLNALLIINEIGSPYGLRIKNELEEYYGEEVNHGRLYPNLDDLIDAGYVDKSKRDKRTNEYAINDAGKEALREIFQWQANKAPKVFAQVEPNPTRSESE